MKQFKGFFLAGIVSTILCPSAWGAVTLCQSSTECSQNCTASRRYCCPTGRTQTVYSCPTGWSLNGTNCTRANASAGSDDKGYKTNIYGSCTAKAEVKKCFESSASPTDGNGMMCMQCMMIDQ